MYQVSIFNGSTETIIHYPSSDKNAPHVFKAELDEKSGQATIFKFTLLYNNPGYNLTFDLITLCKVVKLETGEVVFDGRVYNSEDVMSSSGEFYKDVIAESELSYLNDTRMRPLSANNMTIGAFIGAIVTNHNSHVGTDKHFTVGNLQVTGSVTCEVKYENSLNLIIDKVVNTFGGYLRVRKSGNTRYLDYLPVMPGTSADIILTKNMKDVSYSKDVTNIATRIIPLGKDGLTIASVNSGVDYLENTDAVTEYGIIEQTVEFKDVIAAATLKTQALAKLDDISNATYKLNTNVLDLSLIGLDESGFYCGTDTTISNEVMGINQAFAIIEKTTDLLSPENCKITLNDKFETMTDRQISLQRIQQIVDKILSPDNNLNTFYLDGYIDLLKNQMGAMADTAEKQLATAILFEDTIVGSPTYGALAIGTQGFMIADTIVNDAWDFRTFGTGKGFTADLIVLGHLLGGAVDFDLNQGILKISHTDGSYSLLDANGIRKHVGSTNKDYHYLCETGEVMTTAANSPVTISLDPSFQGKQFKVIVGIMDSENPTPYNGETMVSFTAYVDDESYNYANGTVSLYGWGTWYDCRELIGDEINNTPQDRTYTSELRLAWTAIA